jgi:hypothetical protein
MRWFACVAALIPFAGCQVNLYRRGFLVLFAVLWPGLFLLWFLPLLDDPAVTAGSEFRILAENKTGSASLCPSV